MLAMDQIHHIRQLYFEQDKQISEITQETGRDPKTSLEEKAKALATIEDENDKKVTPKWKNPNGSLVDFCGLRL